MNSSTGPDDQGWGQPGPRGRPKSPTQLALPQAAPPRRKWPSRARCMLQTQSHRSPPGRCQSQSSVLVKPAPQGGSPPRLGSIVSLSLRSKFSLGGTHPFDSFTHSLKANKSNCFSKLRHAHHRAGHAVETASIYRWAPARRLQFTLARSRTNRATYTAVVRLSSNSRDVGCHFRRIHTRKC